MNAKCTITNEIYNYFDFIEGRKLAIWGMGDVGNALCRELLELNALPTREFEIECFDSKKEEYKDVHLLQGKHSEYFVIVSFVKDFYDAERLLTSYGYREVYDFICLGKISNLIWFPEYIHHGFEFFIPENHNNRLLVLGNGPSLKMNIDNQIDFFKDNDCICVNMMANYNCYEVIRPKYYIMIDPAFFLGESNLSKDLYESIQCTFKMIREKTQWEMYLFIPYNAYCSFDLKIIESNSNIRIVPISTHCVDNAKDLDYKYMLYDKGYAMPQAMNVLVGAIFLGIRMSYREILLFGADHSWTETYKHDNKGLFCSDRHFYNLNAKKEYMYSDGTKKKLRTSREEFHCLEIAFRAYEQLNLYASKRNVKIQNATPNSFIDAFPYLEIDKINLNSLNS